MAKRDKSKNPGRIRQLWRVYKITAKQDKSSVWVALFAFLLSLGVGLALSLFTSGGNPFLATAWIVSSVITGILLAMVVMSRRAERMAFLQIEGQAGAVGAVLDSQIRRSWRANSRPIAVAPKTMDAVYRMVGRPGVVLIGEGSSARLRQMLDDEQRKVQRAAPGVPVTKLVVTLDDSGIRLHLLLKTVYKLGNKLTKSEVTAVSNRLESLGNSLPIPKGIDPMRFRPSKRQG